MKCFCARKIFSSKRKKKKKKKKTKTKRKKKKKNKKKKKKKKKKKQKEKKKNRLEIVLVTSIYYIYYSLRLNKFTEKQNGENTYVDFSALPPCQAILKLHTLRAIRVVYLMKRSSVAKVEEPPWSD